MEETLERIDEPREGGVRTTGGRERRRENLSLNYYYTLKYFVLTALLNDGQFFYS